MIRITIVGSYVTGITIDVPRMPVFGEALIGDVFILGPGGKGTNQAIGAVRIGASVVMLASLGDDVFADLAMNLYEKEGIDCSHIQRIKGINTGVGCVTLLPSGENYIVGYHGANPRLSF